jgi:hypothetical protein
MEESKESAKDLTNADDKLTVEVEETNINPKIASKKISPFIKHDKTWDDEDFKIPE